MKELVFTISEASCVSFAIGEKACNIKCRSNSEYNYCTPQRELFKAMEEITERFNNLGMAVLFEID